MKITILAVGSEAQYQPTFDTAYQYLKKETAALSAELSYAICRPDAAELFAALRNAMGQSEAVVLLLSPEPAAVSTALRVVCGGLERTAQTDAALQKQLEARAARMGLTLGYEQLADFASCPSGATQLPNAQGLVQGYAIAARRQLLMALPALPGELSALYPSAVRPLLGKLAGLAVSYATVRVLELDQFSVPQEITRLSQNPHLKLTSRHQCGDYTIFVEATGAQDPDGTIPLTLLGGRRAVFRPASPVSLPDWFKARNEDIARQEAEHQKKAAQKSYVEKSNKDETFRYHIAKVVEEDDSLQEEPVLTDADLVLGIRPEFLDIADSSALEGEIYGAMPTGMESTIKVRVGDFLLTGVIFGSSLFTIGAKVPLSISGDNIMLFDRKSGRCIAFGSLSF